MKEVEIKVKIDNFGPVIEQLEGMGCEISEPLAQHDIIFDKKGIEAGKRNILRIRVVRGKSFFTLKQDVKDELDCIEKEVEISDPVAMRKIIGLLGYEKVVEVNKMRRKCKYGDFEICFDEVDGLGSFIEIEKISDKDADLVRKELLDFIKSLGVDVSKRVFLGYDTMLAKKITRL